MTQKFFSVEAKYFLGVDGGATQTRAVIIDEEGEVLGEGKGGGGNYRVVGLSGLVKNLRKVIFEAAREAKIKPRFSLAVFGLAGCDSANDQKLLRDLISKDFNQYFPSFLVINDTRIALRSGTEDHFGLVVISGTGSNIYGRNEKGKEALAGGLDYLLADEGSAYEIGLKVLRAAVRSFDGREKKSLLARMVTGELGVQTMREATTKVYQPSFGKAEIASFAPLAEKAARLGDQKAGEILLLAAHELFLGVKAAVGRLGMRKEKFDLVLVGSVFKNKIVLREFQKEVSKFTLGAHFVFPKITPAHAAALLAREEYVKIEKEVENG